MRKLFLVICLCLFVASSVYSKPLSDCYADQAAGVVCLGNADAKYLFDLDGKETETTKVTKAVIASIKKRFAIDLENQLEQIGFFVISKPGSNVPQMSGQPGQMRPDSFEFVGYIGGNFEPKNIVPLIKEMAEANKESIKIGSISVNGKKAQALFAKDFRLIFYSRKILLLCKESAVNLMENQSITFSKAPSSVEGLMERSDSFLYLGKEAAIKIISSEERLKVPGVELVESLSCYLQDGLMYGETGFKDEATAQKMMADVEKFNKDYLEIQTREYEMTKEALKNTSLENFLILIGKLYSSARNKDYINDLNISQKGSSIISSFPFDGYGKTMFTIAGVGIVAAMAIPNFQKARGSARQKACFSNIRVLTGAMEMYNMDHNTMMHTLDIDALVKGGYLKSAPTSPEPDCEYYSEGDLTEDGVICCKRHGKLNNIYK